MFPGTPEYQKPPTTDLASKITQLRVCYIFPAFFITLFCQVYMGAFNFGDYIALALLFLATYTLRTSWLVMYIIFSCFSFLALFMLLGKLLQHWIGGERPNRKISIVLALVGLQLAMYFLGYFLTFRVYKLIKAFENGWNPSEVGGRGAPLSQYQPVSSSNPGGRDEENSGNYQSFQAFRGQGVRIGG